MYMESTAEEFGSGPGTGTATPGGEEPESSSQTATEGNLEEEFGDDLMGALRRSKKKKQTKEDEAKAAKESASKEPVIQIKSKKEKEKEKKEREKQKKKMQAERNKTAPQLEPKKPKKAVEEEPEEQAQEEAEDEPVVKKTTTKKKKPNAAIAALQKQLEANKAREEAARLAEEEERRLIEEEERKAAEEERLKEEARAKKREREKQKKEQLRAEGKLLTKKQKEQQALQQRRREQLLASGVIVEALQDGGEEAAKPKRPVYGKSKKKKESTPQPEEQEQKAPVAPAPVSVKEPEVVEPVPVAKVEELTIKDEEGEEEVADSWDAGLASEEEVADSWEAALEEEEGEKAESAPVVEEAKAEVKAVEEAPKAAPADEVKPAVAKPTPAKKTKAVEQPEEEVSVLEKAPTMTAERKKELDEKRVERRTKAVAGASAKNLRSPICCILGHVDTGKTKLLDKVRQTNVQEGEAGGITQQIGATYFPIDAIEKKTKVMEQFVKMSYNVPGLLVIDTPGHESFTNLRSRGSSLCNIAILVVDIMHGLEKQTLESIRLLRDRKTPFVVALNKIDRLYDWQEFPNNSFRDSFAKQKSSVQREFMDRLEKTKLAFAEQGLNAELYFQNKNMSKNVSLIPTSAVTGEGVPDLLYLLLELTQTRMSKQLMYLSELEATVLEVKVIEGLGTTIDVVLSNGILREGDRIVLCGMNGPIATNVRALLTPQPLRELRIKSQYVHNKEVKAALGVKIAANDLEKAVAGSRLLLVGPDDDEDELMDDVMDDLTGLLDSVDTSGKGVCVQASTLGSLEALLDFLKDMKIPVMAVSIGPVYKRDVMRATTMLEKDKSMAVMLCFDVKIDKEAQQYADEQRIKIFSADIIYHLFDEFTAYQTKMNEERKKELIHDAVYPCHLKTIQLINKRNPMIIGVEVVRGTLKIGTPICAVRTEPNGVKQVHPLGRVVSLEVNHQSVEQVRKGQASQGVAMRLEVPSSGFQPTWGRHMDEKDPLFSLISRKSIDVLKDPLFRSSVPMDEWKLIQEIKPMLGIK